MVENRIFPGVKNAEVQCVAPGDGREVRLEMREEWEDRQLRLGTGRRDGVDNIDHGVQGGQERKGVDNYILVKVREKGDFHSSHLILDSASSILFFYFETRS